MWSEWVQTRLIRFRLRNTFLGIQVSLGLYVELNLAANCQRRCADSADYIQDVNVRVPRSMSFSFRTQTLDSLTLNMVSIAEVATSPDILLQSLSLRLIHRDFSDANLVKWNAACSIITLIEVRSSHRIVFMLAYVAEPSTLYRRKWLRQSAKADNSHLKLSSHIAFSYSVVIQLLFCCLRPLNVHFIILLHSYYRYSSYSNALKMPRINRPFVTSEYVSFLLILFPAMFGNLYIQKKCWADAMVSTHFF
jgi:hypothetical protein